MRQDRKSLDTAAFTASTVRFIDGGLTLARTPAAVNSPARGPARGLSLTVTL
ncbi:hypothetical protein [Actinoplanes sichuanensis]|uniref:Uncharacterized protein n=1 Tax=Actinoplanes sichuanensis TaxID=512349 RepID=A0ABW4A2U3_9ACTN